MHATPRDQKDYIRDGTKGFGVAIELEDGTQIMRMKMASANSYRVVYPNDDNGQPIKPTWEINKIDSGLPKAVQEVMGMIEEPETKEFLHIRTYEDQLLFVTTASSANYKVMYNALQISQLVDAIKLGQKEANSYKTRINQTEISADTLQNKANELKIIDIEPLQNIRDRLSKEKAQIEMLERALELKKRINKQIENLGELDKIQSLTEINVSQATTLTNINKTFEEVQKLKLKIEILSKADNLGTVETTVVSKLESALNRLKLVRTCKSASEKLLNIECLNEIQLNDLVNIQRAVELQAKIDEQHKRLAKINIEVEEISESSVHIISKMQSMINLIQRDSQSKKALEKANEYCNQITQWFKAIGVNVGTCPNCGESVVIEST